MRLCFPQNTVSHKQSSQYVGADTVSDGRRNSIPDLAAHIAPVAFKNKVTFPFLKFKSVPVRSEKNLIGRLSILGKIELFRFVGLKMSFDSFLRQEEAEF